MRMHDTEAGTVDEDWDVLVSFLPQDWRELAHDTGALKGLRKDKTVDNLLRTLLLHLGCGHSLRETVVRARQAHLADLSDVALLKRLKKSKGWLHALCVRLFQEQGWAVIPGGAFQVRAVDATTVKEPGPSGSLWRLHYSVCLPSLACDFFKLTGTEGPGTGESLAQFPIRAGDHVLADRGYSTARGIRHVVYGTVDGLGHVAQVLLAMLDVDDFDGFGAHLGGQVPDPAGTVADDDLTGGGVEAVSRRVRVFRRRR